MITAGALISQRGEVVNASSSFIDLIAQRSNHPVEVPFVVDPETCSLCRCIRAIIQDERLGAAKIIKVDGFEYQLDLQPASKNQNGVPLYWLDVHYANPFQMQTQFLEQTERDANIGGWELNLSNASMRWSKQVYRIFDLSFSAELTTESTLSHFSAVSRPKLQTLLRECELGQRFDDVFDANIDQGKLAKVRVTGYPVRDHDDKVVTLRGVMQDVTQQWFEKDRTNLAIEGANIGIWQMEHKTGVLSWNDPMYRIYGKRRNGQLSYADWRDAVVADDIEMAERAFTSSVLKATDFSNSFRITDPESGDIRHIKAIAKTYYDEHQDPIRSIGVNIDISQIKRQEEQLLMEKTMQAQHSKLAAIGEMAAGVGHEINNPLSVALGNLQLLTDKLTNAGSLDDTVQSYIDKQHSALERIRTIVGGLRRLIRNETEDEMAKFNVNELVSSSIELVGQIYAQTGVEVTLVEHGGAVIQGHFGELQQVLMNLFSNAKDAVADTDDKRIEVRVESLGHEVCISVRDWGIGMDEKTSARVFDNFFTLKPSGQGTGLGLSICERIVSEHDGRIVLSSAVGQGSTFKVYLPCSPSAEGNAVPSAIAAMDAPRLDVTDMMQGYRAVIVDDEPMMLQVLKAYLELMGMTVFATSRSSQAIKALQTGNYQILLTDLCMPDLDGWELIQQAKQMDRSGLKTIAMTGGTSVMSESAKGVKLQADGILYKPFDRASLQGTLSKVIAGK